MGEIARGDGVAAVAVEAEAYARGQAVGVVGAYDLYQFVKAGEAVRQFAIKVEQNVVVVKSVERSGDDDGRFSRERRSSIAMGYEAGGRLNPQQAVYACRDGRVGGEYHYPAAGAVTLADHLAGGGQLVVRIVQKLNLGHRASLRSSRKWVSSGTGLPVAPFSLPERQAVPAISRCAHL